MLRTFCKRMSGDSTHEGWKQQKPNYSKERRRHLGKQIVFIRKKIRKTPYILFYTYLLIALLSIFSVASYTWFTLSWSPRVNGMNVYITSNTGLELAPAPDAEVWSNQLDIYKTEELRKFANSKERPSLRQVTWSDKDECFYGPLYGYDGRLLSVTGKDYENREIVSWYKLEDLIHANSTADSNYYMKATFYARCGQPVDVLLAEPMEVDSQGTRGSGTYVIADPNTGKGPETAVRIGFRMTPVDQDGTALSEKSAMYVYEPNADRHADGSMDLIPTYSIDEYMSADDVSKKQEEWLLVDGERLIRQNFSQKGKPGEFIENPTLFTLNTGDIMKIELYIWLEGQDVDCSNIMSDGVTTTRIEANIQFTGTSESQSGLVPIPNE